MLIQTDDGFINTDHVVSARTAVTARGVEKCFVSLAGDPEKTVNVGLHAFEQACGVIVPAQPGFVVIRAILPDRADEDVIYIEEPVIAFRIGHGGEHDGPMPITVSGEPSNLLSRTRWTTRQPNGACFGPDSSHDTVDAFKGDCEREAVAIRSAA